MHTVSVCIRKRVPFFYQTLQWWERLNIGWRNNWKRGYSWLYYITHWIFWRKEKCKYKDFLIYLTACFPHSNANALCMFWLCTCNRHYMRRGLVPLPVGPIQWFQKVEENQVCVAEHFQSSIIGHLGGTPLVPQQLTDSPLDVQAKAQHSITSLCEAAEKNREGQKSYSMVRTAQMLERTFLGVPNAESPHTVLLLSFFVQQHLPSSLGLGEALPALVEAWCKNYLEVHHAKDITL